MTFILGQSRLSYDFFGEWTRVLDVCVDVPDGVYGDASTPGSAQPGTFAPCGDLRPFKLDVTVQ